MTTKKKEKKLISLTDNGIFYKGSALRDCYPNPHISRDDVTINNKAGNIVTDATEFNEIFEEFVDSYPLKHSIDKIVCQEMENEFKITIERRLPKVHDCYELVFFYSRYSKLSYIEGLKKERREIEDNPSLPIKNSEEKTVDQEKLEELTHRITEAEEEMAKAVNDNPDLEFRLSTVKSEYKGQKTVITFAMWPDDVYRVLQRKIKEINGSHFLFLTPKS